MSKSSIIIAGDCCLHGRLVTLNAEQLSSLFEEVKPIIQSADTALVNLETAVIESELHPIQKAGPALKTDARILEMLRTIGFTGVTLANNHFADYGAEGVKESLQLLEEYKLSHMGAGMNADEAAEIKYLPIGDKKVAIINACEHEFTVATDNKAGCNALNPNRQFSVIKEAKQKADFVIVIIHGGVEHYNLPTKRMQETYRFFVEVGADAVINHHQHCYSGYEIYKEKPIIYGLGNFFFDWQWQDANWNEGYMVRLNFSKKIEIELIPYIQNAESIGIHLMADAGKDQFFVNIQRLNAIIADSKQLQSHFSNWVQQKRDEYLKMLQPKKSKNIRRLERVHLINDGNREKWTPEYMTEERQLLLKSLFQCEAHNDVMNELLNETDTF